MATRTSPRPGASVRYLVVTAREDLEIARLTRGAVEEWGAQLVRPRCSMGWSRMDPVAGPAFMRGMRPSLPRRRGGGGSTWRSSTALAASPGLRRERMRGIEPPYSAWESDRDGFGTSEISRRPSSERSSGVELCQRMLVNSAPLWHECGTNVEHAVKHGHRFSASQRSSDVLHQQHEVQLIGRAVLELGHEVTIEVAGVVRLGVHQQATTTDVVGQLEQPGEDVLQQCRAETATLVSDVDAEPGEQRDGLRVSARALAKPRSAPNRCPAGPCTSRSRRRRWGCRSR